MSRDYDDYDDEDQVRREERAGGEGPEEGTAEAAKQRTSVPGILLIILGVLNLLGGAYFVFNGIVAMTPMGKQMAKAQMEQMNPQQKQEMEKMGWSMDSLISGVGSGYAVVGGIGIVVAILTIVAGAMMRGLRGYVLAVICSILVCLPFISFPGCCLIGQIFGIWSLVVLLSPDVRSAFR
jgi:hypothetical protein